LEVNPKVANLEKIVAIVPETIF